MARIAGVDLPKNKRTEIGLTYIYGIGVNTAKEIVAKAKVDGNKRVGELNDEEVAALRSIIQSDYKVEGALRSESQLSIKRLMDIGCYRGLAPPEGPAGAGTADADEFPHAQGKEKNRCRQEKNGRKEVRII